MGAKEPRPEGTRSSLSKVDIQQMIAQLEDAKRLLYAVGTEFPHLHNNIAHARSLLIDIVFALEKPDQGKSDVEDDDEGGIDYIHWIGDQPWPEGATHVTLDKQGGCIWWKLAPVPASAREYGWKPREHGGELIERYYDPAMPFSGPRWRESLRAKPQEDDTPPIAYFSDVASSLAIAMLQRTLDEGKSISIPSMGIVIEPPRDTPEDSDAA